MPEIWRDFGATNEPATCLWCGDPLAVWVRGDRGYGGAGHFCSLRCAFNFAERMVELGRRFNPVSAETVEAKKAAARDERARQREAGRQLCRCGHPRSQHTVSGWCRGASECGCYDFRPAEAPNA